MTLKAFLVGINSYPDKPLKGCVNDVVRMKDALELKYGAQPDNIRLLTDKEASRAAILDGIRWLAEGSGKGTTCLFHYSGHGTRAADEDEEEEDGWDECLVPRDHWTNGLLLDDTLAAEYKRVSGEAHLVLIMDSCHSGTVNKDIATDGIFKFIKPPAGEIRRAEKAARTAMSKRDAEIKAGLKEATKALIEQKVPADQIDAHIEELFPTLKKKYEKKHFGLDSIPGNAVLIAGCRDDQTSADARFATGYQGALTYFLLDALRSSTLSYGDLIKKVGSALEEKHFSQVPRLECSSENVGAPFLKLG